MCLLKQILSGTKDLMGGNPSRKISEGARSVSSLFCKLYQAPKRNWGRQDRMAKSSGFAGGVMANQREPKISSPGKSIAGPI